MTAETFAELVAYWQDRLGLHNWRVQVVGSQQPTVNCNGDDAHAFITMQQNVLSAAVEVALGADEDMLREAACHEMLHLALHDLGEAEDSILACLSAGEKTLAQAILQERRESLVIRLTRAFMEASEPPPAKRSRPTARKG